MNGDLEISGLMFEVRRSPRRRAVGLTVDRVGDLVVHAPLDVPEAELRRWVMSKLLWVHQRLAQKHSLVRDVHSPEFVSGESIFYLGNSYRLRVIESAHIPLRFDGVWFELARSATPRGAEHFQKWYIAEGAAWLRTRSSDLERLSGQTASRIIVGDLGFRWGSCGKNGILYFNWRLLQLPIRLIDSVVIHEQMHRLHHDHSPAFWRAMDSVLPDWRDRKDELEHNWGRYARFASAALPSAPPKGTAGRFSSNVSRE